MLQKLVIGILVAYFAGSAQAGMENTASRLWEQPGPTSDRILLRGSEVYARIGDPANALLCLEQQARLDPNWAGGHWRLAASFARRKQKIPETLALCRFLTLRPNAPRASAARERLAELLLGQTDSAFTPDNPDMQREESATAGDRDFSLVGIGLAFKRQMRPEGGDESRNARLHRELTILFEVLAEMPTAIKAEGFVWRTYAPYFEAALRNGRLKMLLDTILQAPAPRLETELEETRRALLHWTDWNFRPRAGPALTPRPLGKPAESLR